MTRVGPPGPKGRGSYTELIVPEPPRDPKHPPVGDDLGKSIGDVSNKYIPTYDIGVALLEIVTTESAKEGDLTIDRVTKKHNEQHKDNPISVSACSLALNRLYYERTDEEKKKLLKPIIDSRSEQLERFSFKLLYNASILGSFILYIITFGQYSLKSRIDGWTQELSLYNKISNMPHRQSDYINRHRQHRTGGWNTGFNSTNWSDVSSVSSEDSDYGSTYNQPLISNPDVFNNHIDQMAHLRFTEFTRNNCWLSTVNLVLLNDKETFKIHYRNAHDKFVRLSRLLPAEPGGLNPDEIDQRAYLAAFLDFFSAITKPNVNKEEVKWKGQELRKAMTPFCRALTITLQMPEGANKDQRQNVMMTAQTGVYEMLPDMLRGIYPDVTITIPPDQYGNRHNPEKTACEFVVGIENIALDETGLYVLDGQRKYLKDTSGGHINNYNDLLELLYDSDENTQIQIGEDVRNIYQDADSVLDRSYIEYNLLSALKTFVPRAEMATIDVTSKELYNLSTTVSLDNSRIRTLENGVVETSEQNTADTVQLNLDQSVYDRGKNERNVSQIESIQESIAFTQDGFEPFFDGVPPRVRERRFRYLTQKQVCLPYTTYIDPKMFQLKTSIMFYVMLILQVLILERVLYDSNNQMTHSSIIN